MSLDEAIDELYGADLDDFVAERARLAKGLREEGDGAGAQTMAKLRKPSVASWVLNQLARRNRREVDLLLDAGHRLREAHAGALSGAEREAFEDGRELLARGRFVQPMRGQGFDLVSELAGSIAPAAPAKSTRAADRGEEREAKQALRDAKAELRAAEQEARDAQREAERRRTEAEQAEREAEDARGKAEAAAALVEEAEKR